jgi:hypothetical protein
MTNEIKRQLFKIEKEFESFTPLALTRLSYLFPEASLESRNGYVVGICSESADAALKKEIAYAFYRERIATQNIRLREILFTRAFSDS